MTRKLDITKIMELLQTKQVTMTEEEVEALVKYYLNKIVSLTGISLDVNTHHYTLTNKDMVKKVILPLYNIFDVDEVHCNFELVSDDDYFVDVKNGIIFFKKPLHNVEHLHIKYLTRVSDEELDNVILPLVTDMIIDGIDNDGFDGGFGYGDISSIHEGGVSISFKSGTNLTDSINDRLKKLSDGLLLTSKVKKQTMYL